MNQPLSLPAAVAFLIMWPGLAMGQGIPGLFVPDPADAQYPFYHGVASGDATHEAVVLWTRLSFEDEQEPFAAFGTVEVATDTAFADIVLSEPVQSQAALDWCVKADVGGLEPDSWYYYRFRFDVNTVEGPQERTSITGRTKTMQAPGLLPGCGRWLKECWPPSTRTSRLAGMSVLLNTLSKGG